jgi:hypothetical protein
MSHDMTKEAEKAPYLLASELQQLVCMIEEAKDDQETKMKAAADTSDLDDSEKREDVCDYSPQHIAGTSYLCHAPIASIYEYGLARSESFIALSYVECLTTSDYQIFKQLQYREFFAKAWQRKDISATTSPTILKMIDVFNEISIW